MAPELQHAHRSTFGGTLLDSAAGEQFVEVDMYSLTTRKVALFRSRSGYSPPIGGDWYSAIRNNAPLLPLTSISRRIREAVIAAGMVDDARKPTTSTHGLRATGISIVADAVGIEVASRMTRHTRTATTEMSYASRAGVEPQRAGAAVFDE